jgi:hypothetical protein
MNDCPIETTYLAQFAHGKSVIKVLSLVGVLAFDKGKSALT